MPTIKIEARQVIDAILKDNEFLIAFLNLCQFFADTPLSRMFFLSHTTHQIAKVPENLKRYAASHAVLYDETATTMFPTFANHVLPADPSSATEATLLAYSTYTVLANIFGQTSFYLPQFNQAAHQVITFPSITLYLLVRAIHITADIDPIVTTPDIDTPELLADWMNDLHMAITGPFSDLVTTAPSLYSQVTYPTGHHVRSLRIPLNGTQPNTHRLILLSVHAIMQPIIGLFRKTEHRILYKCKELCYHAPQVLYERDSVSDIYFRVTLDLTTQFSTTQNPELHNRETPQQRQFSLLLQSLPVEIKAHIFNYHIENMQQPSTTDCRSTQAPANRTSFIRCSYLPLHTPHRATSTTSAEFFLQLRLSYSTNRRNSTAYSAFGEVYPETRIQRVHSPVLPSFQDMHIDAANTIRASISDPQTCSAHDPTLHDLNWTS
uniref:49 kDa protein n=1 Tax=Alternaria zinniae dsRNA element TaxID=543534 RepID=B3V7B2_9VIRU|nr:49 kDa protein [Alternaria zinniae dsRNA element]